MKTLKKLVRPGRPTKDSPITKRFQVRIPLELYARAETFARKRKVPVSEAIRQLVSRGLESHHAPEA